LNNQQKVQVVATTRVSNTQPQIPVEGVENRRANTQRIRSRRVADIVSMSNHKQRLENPNISNENEEADDDAEQPRIDPELENVVESPREVDNSFIGRRIEEIKGFGYTSNEIIWAKKHQFW